MTRVLTGVIQGHNLARSLQSANFVVLEQKGDRILVVCLSFLLEVKCVFAQVRWESVMFCSTFFSTYFFSTFFLVFAVICTYCYKLRCFTVWVTFLTPASNDCGCINIIFFLQTIH